MLKRGLRKVSCWSILWSSSLSQGSVCWIDSSSGWRGMVCQTSPTPPPSSRFIPSTRTSQSTSRNSRGTRRGRHVTINDDVIILLMLEICQKVYSFIKLTLHSSTKKEFPSFKSPSIQRPETSMKSSDGGGVLSMISTDKFYFSQSDNMSLVAHHTIVSENHWWQDVS